MQIREIKEQFGEKELEEMGIYLERRSTAVNTVCCFPESGHWVLRDVVEKGKTIEMRGNEELISEKILDVIDKKSKEKQGGK